MEDMAVCSVMSNLQNIDKTDCLSNTSAQFFSLQCLPNIKITLSVRLSGVSKHLNTPGTSHSSVSQTSKTHHIHLSPMSQKHLNTPYTPLSHISQTSKHTYTALIHLSPLSPKHLKHTLYISLQCLPNINTHPIHLSPVSPKHLNTPYTSLLCLPNI